MDFENTATIQVSKLAQSDSCCPSFSVAPGNEQKHGCAGGCRLLASTREAYTAKVQGEGSCALDATTVLTDVFTNFTPAATPAAIQNLFLACLAAYQSSMVNLGCQRGLIYMHGFCTGAAYVQIS